MQSTPGERKFLVCLAALLAAAVSTIFTACGGGIVAPLNANTSQQSSAPTVISVVPNTGSPAGGTAVTINGSNFTSSSQQASLSVSFGGVPATHVTLLSSSQLSAVVPPHAAGSVSVKVTTADGKSSSLAAAFTYTTKAITVSSVSPISGPAAGGTTVTVSGGDFQAGASVTFGGFPATSVRISNSATIVAVTPAHASGSTAVTVTNSNGQSAQLASGFTFHSIDLLWNAPSSSPVTIAGYNVYRGFSSAGPFGQLNGPSPIAATTFADKSVQGSTTYYYEVAAKTTTCSTPSESTSVPLTCSNPEVPSPTLTANSNGSIRVSWSTATGATVYTVSRSTSSGGTYTNLSTATALSYDDGPAGLTNGTVYYYKVTAGNAATTASPSGQCTAQSAAVSTRSCIIPAVPTGVSVTRTGNNRVTVAWTNSTGALSYYIQRSDGTNVRVPQGSPYVDSSAANGTAYTYVLSAASDTGGLCSSGNSTPGASVPVCLVRGSSDDRYRLSPESSNAYCFVTCWTITGLGASNNNGRTLAINGTTMNCPVNTNCDLTANPLPPKNGGYVFQVSACPGGGVTCYNYPEYYWWGSGSSCP